ncbi:MAG: phosphoesterase [Desulfurococcales archaeon]|nr:phosphoesterase [Desulfurococcales archaeon]
MEKKKIGVIADWDADGVVSAAIIIYVQEKLGKFPIRGKVKPEIHPAGPRSISEVVNSLIKEENTCWENLVILDIPYTNSVEEALKEAKEKCNSKIYYFDHHESTIDNMAQLEEKYNAFIVVGKSPTAVLLQRFLDGMGIRLTPRLYEFVRAVAVLEGSKRMVSGDEEIPQGIVDLAASISKSLNQMRSKNAWIKYARWLSNPIPFEGELIRIGSEKEDLLKKGMEISKLNDEEIRSMAMDLALSARNLGYIKFVDARGKWDKRGSSALASAIYRILGKPVAVLFEKDDGSRILIIRSSRGNALKIIEVLDREGAVEDKGGHGNIGIAKLRDEVTIKRLEKLLIRASFEVVRREALDQH